MTPTTRIFTTLLETVARAYELDTERLTTESGWPPPPVREARAIVCLVAVDTLGLSLRQVGRLMQRDHKAIERAVKLCRQRLTTQPVLRRVAAQISTEIKEQIRDFDIFERGAAE
jgi:hypothetical protein